MANFIPRTSEPGADNKYYVNYSHGGYNTAIVMNSNNGYVIPNCVGYAQGRLREIQGDTNVWSKIGCNLAGNAETFYRKAKEAGMSVGQTPKLGAIICWEGVGPAAGHVAVVEEIHSNGDIVTSNSAYNGTHFYMQTLTKSSGYLYNTDGSRPLNGFVYCDIDFDEPEYDEPECNDSSDCEYSVGDVVMLDDGVKWNNNSTPASWVFSKELTVTRIDNGNLLVLSTQGINGAATGVINASCVHRVGEASEPEEKYVPKRDSLDKGDIVHFTGNTHYTSSYKNSNDAPASPCEAEVTVINNSSSSSVIRKYHLVGDGVYGWVNSEDIAELN